MVKTIKRKGKTIFLCEICGLGYSDEETAIRCEKFCRDKNACSREITRKAIYIPKI